MGRQRRDQPGAGARRPDRPHHATARCVLLRASRTLGLTGLLALIAAAAGGCATQAGDGARDAADAYARAAASGDADALYDMMTARSRAARTRAQVRLVVADERTELAERARALTGAGATASHAASVAAHATLRFGDGEEASLQIERGHYRVTSAGTLPGGGRTTGEALDNLRRVVARRSYAGLMAIVTASTRAAIERDLRSLVLGLEKPRTLQVETHGDDAEVAVPGGHHVRLHRDGDMWRVADFD